MRVSNNIFPKLKLREVVTADTPEEGVVVLFADSADNKIKCKNHAGDVIEVGGGGSSATVVVDDTLTPSGNTGTVAQLLSWLANRIKTITGKSHWYSAPDITLATTATHVAATSNPHNVTASQVGALASIDGVSNAGGNVDLVAGANITITPDDSANTITIAASGGGGGGGLSTINTIAPDGEGNFALVAGSNITLTPGTNQITIASSGGGGGGGGGGITMLSAPVALGRWNQGDTTVHNMDISSYVPAEATSALIMVTWFENGGSYVLWPGNASNPGIDLSLLAHPIDRVAGSTYPGIFITADKGYLSANVWVGISGGYVSIAPWENSWKRFYVELQGYSI